MNSHEQRDKGCLKRRWGIGEEQPRTDGLYKRSSAVGQIKLQPLPQSSPKTHLVLRPPGINVNGFNSESM
jgi:hypothetical protein